MRRSSAVIVFVAVFLVSPSANADQFSASMKIVGTIQPGQTVSMPYTSNPLYRALRLYAKSGARIGVLVKSANGDPILWVTDASMKILSMNDDVPGGATTDSFVSLSLPPNSTPDNSLYWIIVREYNKAAATFAVKVSTDARVPLHGLTPRTKAH